MVQRELRKDEEIITEILNPYKEDIAFMRDMHIKYGISSETWVKGKELFELSTEIPELKEARQYQKSRKRLDNLHSDNLMIVLMCAEFLYGNLFPKKQELI